MTQFVYPIVNLLVGLALSVYGLIHAATHVPAGTQMQIFYSAIPSLGAVLVFLLGVLAVAGGMSLLASGVQGLKKRKRQINRIYRTSPEPYDDDDRDDYYR
jgi:fumarate reductase subunit D